jgi:beta-lactamase superfamily II metal-dependent hydrolase
MYRRDKFWIKLLISLLYFFLLKKPSICYRLYMDRKTTITSSQATREGKMKISMRPVFIHAIWLICIVSLIFGATTETARAAGTCGTGTWTAGNLEIHHINIGQGDSTLVVGPTGKTLLFDAGESNWNSSSRAQIIGPYIESVLGCKSLDYVIISHFHLDHIGYVGYGGLWNLVETQGFTIGTTLVRNYNTHLGDVSGTFTNWKTYLEGPGQIKLHPLFAVDGTSQVNLGPGVSFDIAAVDGNGTLHAGDFHTDPSPPSENDYSIGAVLSFGAFDEWIGGDLDGQYQVGGFGYTYHDIEFSTAPEVGDVDVYKANHHASSHSSSSTFINQLDPEVTIVTVGDGNTYGHPTQPVMDRLLATSTVYMTERGDTNTNIGTAIVAGNIIIKTANGSTYTVNGTSYTATEPARTDTDGDGYFAEADPNDGIPGLTPEPNGGCGPTYQTCSAASLSCQVAAGQVMINEVFPSPSSNGIEWVELFNTTRNPVDIGYCMIDDIDGGSAPHQIPASTIIPAHGFWTLDRNGYFNNTGDSVRFLKEDAATLLDTFTYGNTGTNLAWVRLPNGGPWSSTPTSATTKGTSNTGLPPTTFADVPATHLYYSDIEILYANGLTAGCSTSPLKFCPDQIMNRGESAVFMLRANFGSSFDPGPSTHVFKDDWTKGAWAEPWADAMYTNGLSAGCSSYPLKYCPWDQIPREQAVIFALRMKYGTNYIPPAATGTLLADMTNPSYYATPWAEQAYKDGLIPNCGTSGGKPKICPKVLVTRGLGAYMIVRAKNLTMP